jgi:uncharacterized protein (TIGR02117 family)
VIIYLLVALLLSVISVAKEPGNPNDVAIYIMTNGDHTDIVIPVTNIIKDWRPEIRYDQTTGKDTTAHYVAIGWGNKDFYLHTPTWAQLNFSLGVRAVLGLGTSAMHTDFCKNIHESDDCKKLKLSNAQYIRLVNYINGNFKRDSTGYPINIKTNANYDSTDAFYEAKGTYSMFCTCNTWANNALKACGQKACVWTPFDWGIFYPYQ